MSDVTLLLQRLQDGDGTAAEHLFTLVYTELRRLAAQKVAREAPGHTVHATSLVHETFLRIGGPNQSFENRAHFFGAAAEAMRRILVERARRKRAEKRGGGEVEHVDIDEVEIIAPPEKTDEMLAVHEALDALAAHDPRKAELVKLRYFVGFSVEATADVLGLSVATVHRDWAYARVWLRDQILAMR